MFTSRAEFRLSLRADNADERLTPLAIEIGLAGKARRERFTEIQNRLDDARKLAQNRTITPTEARRYGLTLNMDGVRRSAYDLLSYAEHSFERLSGIWPELAQIDPKTRERLETEARYAVYLERQRADVERLKQDERREIPQDLQFDAMPGLSNELRDKLKRHRPRTLAEAQKIDGMTPSALAIIMLNIGRTLEKGAA